MKPLLRRILIVSALAMLSWQLAAFAQNTFRIMPESGGAYSSFLRVPPTYVDVRVLGVSSNEDHTVPSGARFVIFSASCSAFYAKPGGTAAVPGGDVTDGSGSELNPSGWFVSGVSLIGLIAGESCIITLSFYR